jgi:hypothetical protein
VVRCSCWRRCGPFDLATHERRPRMNGCDS